MKSVIFVFMTALTCSMLSCNNNQAVQKSETEDSVAIDSSVTDSVVIDTVNK